MKSTKKNSFTLKAWKLALALATALVLSGNSALADSAAEIDRDATAALQTLYANTPEAKDLGDKAKGILVFPNIVRAGSSSPRNSATAPFVKREGRLAIIDRWQPRTASRPEFSHLVTFCFLWMTNH